MFEVEKIIIMGVSPGVGKSTFGRCLSEELGVEVTHLDRLYWRPNWVEAPYEVFREAQEKIVQRDQWIIEGNYTGTLDIREQCADTVIYLERPLIVCLYRVLKRRIHYQGRNREDMAEGCQEKIDWEFVKFIVQTYRSRKKEMKKRMKRYVEEGKTVYYLKTSAEIKTFFTN